MFRCPTLPEKMVLDENVHAIKIYDIQNYRFNFKRFLIVQVLYNNKKETVF